MAFEDALQALIEHWADVTARLDDGSRDRLVQLLDELSKPDHSGATEQIAELLVETLPRDHPVRRALVGGTLAGPATLDWESVLADLRDLADLPDLSEPSPGSVVLREVTERLLSQPAYTEAEVRELGADPADPGLIRLRRADGSYQWPGFQFTPAEPVPVPEVVRRVNRLLDGYGDPLGVADWWLSRNDWLGETPCRQIGQIPDDLLVQAARAVAAEV
ncbi:MAG TPA: hypothetical protein VFI65_30835 [Streptosporangiaceae bacterium]|nr:hypothetical protein [Streptosporangiaceae bacterium]